MKLNSNLVYCSIAAIIAAVGCTAGTARNTGPIDQQEAAVLRIGTFDTRGVALAYGRSARPDCRIAMGIEIREAHAIAKEAGDEDTMKELEAEVAAIQERIHGQVFSGAPIDDILLLIRDDMAKVAKAANVDLIVSGVLYKSSDLKLVDITAQMCAPFEPDDATQKMITEIIATPLVDQSDLSHDR